jgi:hypothetical protein
MEKAEEVYGILSKKHFNREEPSMQHELKQVIARSIAENKPIPLFGFWGMGYKPAATKADAEALTFLTKLAGQVKEAYAPGVKVTLIFPIEHGLHNGYEEPVMANYVESVKALAQAHGFSTLLLSPLWQRYGISFERVEEEWRKKEPGWWESVPNKGDLEARAGDRNRRLPPVEAAQKYVVMRGLERGMLEKGFAGEVFFTYSPSSDRHVLPRLPTLHLYSLRKGRSQCPWFTD